MNESLKPLPSLNALRVFEVVSRHLNFRLGAEELGVTQAAVAQQIRGLEGALGLKLFERLPRGLALTEAGRTYIVSIRKAFELIDEATRSLRPGPTHLTISVTPSFASKWLIPRLADFTEIYPEIDLRVLATERLSHFQTDGVDIAVRYGKPPFGPGLEAQLLFEQRIVAVGSPALLGAVGKPADLNSLQQFMLLHDSHNFWPQFIAQVFQQPVQVAPKNVRFNQTSLAIEAAIAGQGLALASHFFVRDDLLSGRLARPIEGELKIESGFYLVWPRKARHPSAQAQVRQWLVEQARTCCLK
ncbi:LysR substrate-binding domain-containing protein [Pseudomonas gingeri]|uniref:LysR substrate-binding domain-containing protein n=1 Tax=Pseudomonas gingeri TaxID=117681 RepID=UPI0015A17B3D|nr:LysR substrate-binding domain-containing protein [Pseudomonas gingeri]NWE47539.1 LysR family transcriptional regulator [Pseudomonas gingeri]